ncbi:MAG: alpha/beta hydrolase [Promethearchaeota archaeon]
MSKIKKIISNKRKLGFIISSLLILCGVIPLIILTFYPDPQHPYSIKEISLNSEDETMIKALVYKPLKGGNDDIGIVVAHGFCGNKQYMEPLSIELAKRGFYVVAIDFRGHGSSDGYLPALRRSEKNNPLDYDMLVAVDYLKDKGVKKIGLVGHSMGGSTSLRVAEANPEKIDAVVSIGMISTEYNFSRIHNLLMAIGQFEQIFSRENAIEFLKEYTGKDDVEIGKLYGDFSNGDATKVIIGPTSDHLAEVLDPVIVYEAVQWFEQAFNGKKANDVVLTIVPHQIFYLIGLCGIVSMCFLIIFLISEKLYGRDKKRPVNENFEEKSPAKLFIIYISGALLGSILFLYPLSILLMAVLPLSMGHILYAQIISIALGLLIIYYLTIIRKNKEKKIIDIPLEVKIFFPSNIYRSFFYGIISALLFTIALSSLMHWSTNASFLTAREIGAVFGIVLLFFPFLLMKEFFLRSIQEKLRFSNRFKEYFSMVGTSILLDNVLIVILMILCWQNVNFNIGFIALSLTVVVIFSIIQHFLLTWVYMHSNRDIIASTSFLCIFYGWMIVNFFPFGINSGFF